MTASTMTRTSPPPARTVELVLARAHLRLGSLPLARVELETLAGLGRLDIGGIVDLAEVRWRTGDLLGAGEAAGAALRDHEDEPVALVIAAEAAAALGRPGEARRLAQRAMACATATIDTIFAGMPRSGVWPGDADEPPLSAPTLFDRAPEDAAQPGAVTPDVPPPTAPAAATAATPPTTPGFWDDDDVVDPGPAELPDPALELEAGRSALVAGANIEAAFRFGLALRLAPALAPAVLEATAGARDPNLIMVRGDAYRLAGAETDAREAYASAAHGGLPERRQHSRTKPKAKSMRSPRVDAGDGTAELLGPDDLAGTTHPSDTTAADASDVSDAALEGIAPPASNEPRPDAAHPVTVAYGEAPMTPADDASVEAADGPLAAPKDEPSA